MTLTAPVRGSSATAEPLLPARAMSSVARRCAPGSSVVSTSSPSRRAPVSWSTIVVSPFLPPESGSLRNASRAVCPSDARE